MFRLFISIFALLTILISCKSNEQLKSQKIVFGGKLLNAQERFIKIAFSDTLPEQGKSFEIPLDSNGAFRYSTSINDWSLIKVGIGQNSIYLFLEPDDSLFFTADANSIQETVNFEAGNSESSIYFTESYSTFEDKNSLVENRLKTTNIESCKEFKAYRDSIKRVHLEFLRSHKNKLSPQALKLARAQIDYRWANKLFDYPTLHLFYNGKDTNPDFEEGYHNFINEVALNDSSLLKYDKYTTFVDNFLDHELKLRRLYKGNNYNHTADYNMYNKYQDLYKLAEEYLEGVTKYAMQSFYLQTAIQRGRYETIANQYNDFKEKKIDKRYINPVLQAYEKIIKLSTGKPAPDFTLTSIQNVPVSLSDLRGNVVYLDFWASWCNPCIQLIPHSKELKEDLKDERVIFLNVSLDKNEPAWRKMVDKFNISGINLITSDSATVINEIYNIQALPRYFLIDQEGLIVDSDAKRPDNPKLREDIRKLLAK